MARVVGHNGPEEPNIVSLLHMHIPWGQTCAPQSEHPEAELIHGGAGQIPERIASELEGRIRLDEPVIRISHPARVQVETTKSRFAAQLAVVAMPPHLAGRIIYDPPMTPLWAQLTQRIPVGRCPKILVSYDRPFWREKGLAGIGLGNCQWIELCTDGSDPETGVEVIATFVVCDRYRDWRPMSDRDCRAAVLSDLAIYFREGALSPSTYDEVDWPGEPWVGVDIQPSCHLVWTSFGETLTAPVGRIYWAGTEWPIAGLGSSMAQYGQARRRLRRLMLSCKANSLSSILADLSGVCERIFPCAPRCGVEFR